MTDPGRRGARQANRRKRALWYEELFKLLAAKVLAPSDYVVGVAIGRRLELGSLSCFPGGDVLAKDTGLSTRTVQTAIDNLESAGVLSVERRGRLHANLYTPTLEEPQAKQSSIAEPPRPEHTSSTSSPASEVRQPAPLRPDLEDEIPF